MMQKTSQSRVGIAWLAAALLLAGLAVWPYLGTWSYPFFFDDEKGIVENPGIRQLWPPGAVMEAEPDTTPWGRPLLAYSLALNHAMGGLEPQGYRIVNVGLHLANSGLLLALVALSLRRIGRTRSEAAALGWAVALLWVVHPLTTAAVGYVIQRAEALVAGMILLTLVLVAQAARRRAADPAGRWWIWALGSVLVCGLGMLAKESMVAAPLVAILWLVAFHPEAWRRGQRQATLLWAGGLLSSWLVLAAVMLTWPRGQSVGVLETFGPWESLLTQSEVIVHYLRLAIWPSGLSLDYWWPARRALAEVWPNFLGLAVVALAGLGLWRWSRPWAWLVCSVFLLLAPTSSVVPVLTQLAAEHRMYLPLALLVAALVLGGDQLGRRWLGPGGRFWPVGGGALVVALALVLSTVTAARLRVMETPERAWADVLVQQPRNARAMCNLGQLRWVAGDREGAIVWFRRALEVAPHYYATHLYLGVAEGEMGNLEEAEAHLRRCLELEPEQAAAWAHLGTLYGLRGDRARAHEAFSQALLLAPYQLDAHYGLALWHAQVRAWPEARRHLDAVLRIRPQDADALRVLGAIDQAERNAPPGR